MSPSVTRPTAPLLDRSWPVAPEVAGPALTAAGSTTPAIVDAQGVTRVWGRGRAAQAAVDCVDLEVLQGELVAIVGPSGSGKSTLASMIAGIDRPTAGSLAVAGARIDKMSDDQLARWRGRHVGIVFQSFHLLPTLTASENVELALKLSGVRWHRRRHARSALASVGLAAKVDRLPAELSGGEQQRVGIARAIVVEPDLLVADEPTGSLDQASGAAVFDLLCHLRDEGTTIVFVTHDTALAERAGRVVTMIDGRIAEGRLADDGTVDDGHRGGSSRGSIR